MRKTSCLTAVFLLGGFAAPGSAGAETLQEALVSAYNGNPTLMAQRAKLRAADEGVPQALANWRPSVKLSGDYGKSQAETNKSSVSQAGTFTSTPKDAGVTVTQALYRGGRTTAQTRQAEAEVEATRAQLTSTEQTVLLNVITAYMDVVQFRAVVELSRNNEQVLQRQLDATNDRFRVGEVTRTDVAQAESRLSAAHADRRQAEGNLAASTATYIKVVGHPPDTLFVPGPTEKVPVSVDAARGAAEHNNPDIINAQYSYVAAKEGIDLIAGELLPTVTLTGNAAKNYNYQGEGPTERVLQATVNLTVPIYQQGQE